MKRSCSKPRAYSQSLAEVLLAHAMPNIKTDTVASDLQQLSISSTLSEPRRASIRLALEDFRKTILKQNFKTLRILVQAAEKQVEEASESGHSAEEIDEVCNDRFNWYLIRWNDAKALLSSDTSQVELDGIISRISLDGIDHSPVDFRGRDQWWSSIWTAIIKHRHDIPQFPSGLPEDVRYLSTLANAVLGAGLPYWREMKCRDFLAKLSGYDNGVEGKICIPFLGNWQDETRSYRPEDTRNYHNAIVNWCMEGWEVSVAVNVTAWPIGYLYGTFVVYCCRRSGEGGSGSGGGNWQWRLGYQRDSFWSQLYDTVEEYLAWYAHYKEQTADNIEPEIMYFDD